ncbi:trypsin-like peptidase domain-containing protein [Devosia sp. MC532]|uniref:trypsin-like peptidase domain-containing protein n=1 Tax=Devosia sp. MC532 TaxID=2799788 RepID=UPI0018F6E08C|nr:trypsin-like peptidase domain-containing protein [Devosia sp. MC532]MBJ7577901.1 trypsin-like peptidase domain-containing protein [Devosia sp. MC532]
MLKIKSKQRLRVTLIAIASVFTATAALADFGLSQRWFNQHTSEDRRLLQSNLMLIGHYSGLADGEFGRFTYQALSNFQRSLGETSSGVLSTTQQDRLLEDAAAIYQQFGFDEVIDVRGGMTMLLPKTLLPEIGETKRGTSYSSYDRTIIMETISKSHAVEPYLSLYETLSSGPGRSISYKTIDSSRFVVSGSRGTKRFYTYIYNTPGASVGFSMDWEPQVNGVAAMVATFLASYALPFVPEEYDAKNEDRRGQSAPQSAGTPPQNAVTRGASSGSGFFVAERGVLVTNNHVIDQCETLTVAGYGSARVITSDEDLDLAVLQLDKIVEHPVAEIRSTPGELGESVLALGFPLSTIMDSTLTIGTGIVSAQNGLGGEPRWFTTNVGIQPGNSGGPLLDEFGKVIGVAVAKISDEALLEAMGTTAPNVGFAIKSEVLSDYLSIFRVKAPSESPDIALSPRQLTEIGRQFTVQINCDSAA